jgi:hypothetical protein
MSKITDVAAHYSPQFERVDTLRATAKAALLALKCLDGLECAREEIEALEAALAEPAIKESLTVQRPWVGLTDEEINLIYDRPHIYFTQYAKDIEAKLREKNT